MIPNGAAHISGVSTHHRINNQLTDGEIAGSERTSGDKVPVRTLLVTVKGYPWRLFVGQVQGLRILEIYPGQSCPKIG